MALTNGITLVNKIKTIADAIRRRTPNNTGNLTIDQMVNEIDNEWKIKCYVQNISYVNDGKTWTDYLDNNVMSSGKPAVVSYTDTNDIILTARSLNKDSLRGNIKWILNSVPSGVELVAPSVSGTIGSTDKKFYQSCMLQGINKKCNIVLRPGSDNWGGPHYIEVKIDITYI